MDKPLAIRGAKMENARGILCITALLLLGFVSSAFADSSNEGGYSPEMQDREIRAPVCSLGSYERAHREAVTEGALLVWIQFPLKGGVP